MILDEAEALLDPVSDIDGFMLACLVDASTGMVLASRKDQDDISLPTAAAGAADIANVLSLLAGQLPVDGLEDVMVTFRQGGKKHTVRGYRARAGYNLAAGVGTINAQLFVPELARAAR